MVLSAEEKRLIEERKKARLERERKEAAARRASLLPGPFKPAPQIPEPVAPPAPIPIEETTEDTQQTNQKLTPEERAAATGPIITDRFGNETIQTPQDLAEAKARSQLGPESTSAEDLVERDLERQQGQEFAGQIGQQDQLGLRQPGAIGEFDYAESLVAGLRTSIPSAVGGAAAVFSAGVLGASISAGAGTIAAPGIGTVIGGVLGFLGGITAGILNNMNSQRTDTTTAQQRVLDEGKQTLQDWATYAKAMPSKRREAIKGFNAQLALIDQAYRQMKLDTSRDVLKFETALPNLAEFESFYNLQGERDFLVAEMRASLLGESDINFDMVELAGRYQ